MIKIYIGNEKLLDTISAKQNTLHLMQTDESNGVQKERLFLSKAERLYPLPDIYISLSIFSLWMMINQVQL